MAQVTVYPAIGEIVYSSSGAPISTAGLTVTMSDYYLDLLRLGRLLTYDPLNVVAPPATETLNGSQLQGIYTSDLISTVGAYDNAVVQCHAYDNTADSGGGMFIWRLGDTTTVDGGTILGSTNVGRWHRLYSGPMNVQWFGADPTGAADSTSAIQAAITAGGANSSIYLPRGNYKVTSTITISAQRVHVYGDGMYATLITFAPTANATCISVTAGASVIFQGSIRDIGFYSANTTYTKKAIKIADASGYVVENISVAGALVASGTTYWGGSSSIGIEVAGREYGLFRNLYIAADKPLVITDNANNSLDIDHHNFHDLYVTANANPCVTIANGVNVSNVSFTGAQVWVLGTHGLHWDDTSSTAAAYSVSFDNVRTEQGTDSSAYSFYIASTAQPRQNVTFRNCYTEHGRNGYFFRKVQSAVLDSCVHVGTSGTTIDAVGEASYTMSLRNCLWQVGGSNAFTTYRELWASPKQVGGAPIAPSAEYAYIGSNILDYPSENGVKTMCFSGTLANGATVSLLCGANQSVTRAYIEVTAIGATKNVGGTALANTRGGTGLHLLVAGTADFDVGNVAGSLTVFCNADTVLWNQLGESVTYVARVTCL